MSIVIRDVREHELDSVLALNNAAGPTILPLDNARLHRFHAHADYLRVAERDGSIAGFLVGFGSDTDHDSDNFLWFRHHHRDFFYIDRIVVASRRRGGGVGRALYADVQSYAEPRHPQLACEVFLEHDASPVLLFHGSFGFREVGQRVMSTDSGAPGIRVAMLMKELFSHRWIRETYGDKLPDVPWLAPRRLPEFAQQQTGT